MGRVSPGSATSVSLGSVTISGTVPVTNAGLTELAAAINGSSQVDVNIAASGITVPVSGTFWQATQPVSGTVAVTGVSTLAEQQTQTTALGTLLTSANFAAAFGTAGTADSQVMSIQGITSMTPVTVTGTVTADLGATDNAVLDAIAASVAAIDTDATTIIGHVDGIETLIGTTNTNTAASTTALQLIDNAVSGAGFNITQLGGVNVSMNTGVRDTGTQRMTIATDDLVPIKIASGQVNSGAIASGAVASGAFASGSIGSGAIASGAVASGAIAAGAVAAGAYVSGSILSGALASGAVVDLTNVSMPITPATATATKTLGLGAEYRSTLPTWTNTQQGALQVGARGALHVELWNSDSATVNPVGSGTATGALRVELPTNGTGTVGLNAGTNNIGDVDIASIAAGDNNIGNVDIVTVPSDPFGANADAASATGSISAKLRFIAATGIPVTGTVAVTQSGTWTDSNSAAIAASLSIVDDWDNGASDGASVSGDVAHDSSDVGEPVKIGMKAYSPDGTTPGTAVAENDRTNAKGDLDGRLFVNTRSPRQLHKHLDGTTAYTDESIAADPGDGFQIVITSIIFSSGEAVAINFFLEEGATKIFGPIYIEAVAGRGFVSGPIYLPVTASTAVTLTTSAGNDQSFDCDYFIQAV